MYSRPEEKLTRRQAIARALGTAAALSLAPAGKAFAASDDFPGDRPITIVVPFGAGGGADTMARFLAKALEKELSATVIVDNRPGAGGRTGWGYITRAKPDGWTLLMGTPHGHSTALMKDLPYDVKTDLTFIAPAYRSAIVLVSKSDQPFKTMEEFVSYAKTQERINVGWPGSTVGQLTMQALAAAAGINLVGIPYTSSGDILTAVLSGQVQAALDTPLPYVNYIKEGQVNGLAAAAKQRLTSLADTPTTSEVGFPEILYEWHTGLFGPAGMPEGPVAKLNQALKAAVEDPEVQQKMRSSAYEPVSGTSEEFRNIAVGEVEHFAQLATKLGFQPR